MSLESILVPEEVLISRSNNDVSRTVFEEREAPMVALREGKNHFLVYTAKVYG